jgi:hypothetical protein
MFLYFILRINNLDINVSNFKLANFVNKMLFDLKFRYFQNFVPHFEKQE